ncbi:amino acid ABC transporter permease (plasmid) [Deinococcus psychrotolerans]|uniref:Amino acid ABC transporter permease n=1 Tax=Deinococcus psychrotolerans TaxID=2489213 RepID=A0A3G8YH59_9DEIO|nr:amino acid ABC transporter permease [Deinococcus psychrotolerans]AZI44628.1 amino acid ABC transporter permease [Deinococcus psychrotolerans]
MTVKPSVQPSGGASLAWLSYFVPGLGQLLVGQTLYGVQFLAAAALVWAIAFPVLQGGSWDGRVLALIAIAALHLGAGITAAADHRRRQGAEFTYAAQQTYKRWSVIVASAVVLFIAGLLVRWIVTLPSWNEVQRNFLFLLIGRFRSEQFADEIWRLWGFGALVLGGGAAFLMTQLKAKFAWVPLVLGVVIGVVMLFPTISPQVNIGGLALSLILAILGIVGAIPLGLLFGVGRTNTLPVMRGLSTIYVELFRSLPFITVIFWFFIFVPYVLGEGTQFWAVVAALALFTGAYVAEIVRAGIQALPTGQAEAARALGLSGTQTMLQVILPQAVRNMIPPLVGQFISLFKDTSLVSIIGLIELAGAGRITANRVVTATFEIYLTVALLYFIFAYLLSLLARRLEAPAGAR